VKLSVQFFPFGVVDPATAKNRSVTRILGFVMNGDFVVLAARSVLRCIRTKFYPVYGGG
jgi:hypothetical protein